MEFSKRRSVKVAEMWSKTKRKLEESLPPSKTPVGRSLYPALGQVRVNSSYTGVEKDKPICNQNHQDKSEEELSHNHPSTYSAESSYPCKQTVLSKKKVNRESITRNNLAKKKRSLSTYKGNPLKLTNTTVKSSSDSELSSSIDSSCGIPEEEFYVHKSSSCNTSATSPRMFSATKELELLSIGEDKKNVNSHLQNTIVDTKRHLIGRRTGPRKLSKIDLECGYANYLKENVGPYLAQGLAQIAIKQPEDPVEFLGNFLHELRTQEEQDLGIEVSQSK